MTEPLCEASGDANETESSSGNGSLNWVRRHWTKLVGLAVWVVLIAAYWRYTSVNDLTPLQAVQQMITFLAANTLGIFVYVLLYMLRPAVFFPATLLTLAAGYLYGPIYGTLIVILASNLSSMVAYLIGRFFGNGIVHRAAANGVLQQYTERMRRNSFETVLVLRFLFLPYDLVSYFAGFLRVKWQGFLLATVLGSVPGTITFILFGAAIEGQFTGEIPRLNSTSFAIAALMFIVSIALSRWFKRRETQRVSSSSEAIP